MLRRWRPALLGLISVSMITLAAPTTATAAECPPASVGGKPVGWVELDGVRTPITRVNYPAGGVLDPPPSNQVVGLSARHRALLSATGTTVLTWHVRFGAGCPGTLNLIMAKPLGATFRLSDAKGESREYRIVERRVVPKGDYDPAWFRVNGAPQVTLFTCTDYRNGAYRKTLAIIATPVDSA
jgi:hypothetical protein